MMGPIMKKDQLVAVMHHSETIFKALSDQYKGIKGYLVFSSSYGQSELTSDPTKILAEFSEMVIESIAKRKAIELIKTVKSLEARKKYNSSTQSNQEISNKIDSERHTLKAILYNLEFRDDTFIEIRFPKPNLDLIFKMQKDPLVSQKHTPQTQASIRIVLGTLKEVLQSVQ